MLRSIKCKSTAENLVLADTSLQLRTSDATYCCYYYYYSLKYICKQTTTSVKQLFIVA